MQLSPTLFDALNAQMNFERGNRDVYEQASLFLGVQNWPGFEHWFKSRSKSEAHDSKELIEYIITREGVPVYDTLPAPTVNYSESILDYLNAAWMRERENTARVQALRKQAEIEGDIAAGAFLDVFLLEQVEDENRLFRAVEEVRRANGDVAALLKLDHDYNKGKRGNTYGAQ